MNNIETTSVKQTTPVQSSESLSRDLQQAIKVINAEYQQIDWEDQTFLNGILRKAIEYFEGKRRAEEWQ